MTTIKPDMPPGRLRRFIAHPAVLLVVGFLVFAFLYPATMAAVQKIVGRDTPLAPLLALVGVAVGIGVWKLYRGKMEGGTDRELAFAGAPLELLAGLAFGFALFAASTAGVALLGGFRIEGVRGIGNLWEMLAVAIFSGFYEEVIFRGVLLRHLETLVGTIGALVLTSAFFGLVHMVNPDATLFAAFAIAVEAGILLGAAYLVTRRLWLAIGLHAAWNFTQGWVFSIPISGTGESNGLLVTTRTGSDWLTGGAFGLEASVIAMAVTTTAGLALLRHAAKQNEIRLPRWWKRSIPAS